MGPHGAEEVRNAFYVYFAAGKEEVGNYFRRMATSRRQTLPSDFMSKPMIDYVHRLLPPGILQRLSAYDATFNKDPSKPFLSDLEHHEGFGPRAGSYFPTCLRLFTIYSFTHQQVALPTEGVSVQGIEMFDELDGGRPLAFEALLRQVAGPQLESTSLATPFMPLCSPYGCSSCGALGPRLRFPAAHGCEWQPADSLLCAERQ